MISYTPQCDFRRKDNIQSGDPDKLVTGAELQAEFEAIQRAINSAPSGSYTIATNFHEKDRLATGTAAKKVLGTEVSAEFSAISTALATLGGTYTPVYNGAALDAADTEITGTPLMVEFEAIRTAINVARAAQVAFFWHSSFYDSSNRTFLFGSFPDGVEPVATLYTRNDGESFTRQSVEHLTSAGIVDFAASPTSYVALIQSEGFCLRAPKSFPLQWSTSTLHAEPDTMRQCVYDSVNSVFVAVGGDGSVTHKIIRSVDDGATWQSVDLTGLGIAAVFIDAIAYANGRLIASGRSGGFLYAYVSTNGGATWVRVTVEASSSNSPRAVAYNGNIAVLVGSRTSVGGIIWYSSDHGATWTQSTSHPFFAIGANGTYWNVIWNADAGLFVAFGEESVGVASAAVISSTNGVAWSTHAGIVTAVNNLTAWGFPSFEYAAEGNVYLKGSNDGIWRALDLTTATRVWPNQ